MNIKKKSHSVSTISSDLQPPITTSAPYFVIQDNECLFDWLIKRILLVFQGCYSNETINDSIAVFSTLNIAWLTSFQIQHLREEKIQQLSTRQLHAFSQKQIGYFSASQRMAFQHTLQERQTEAVCENTFPNRLEDILEGSPKRPAPNLPMTPAQNRDK